MHYIDTSVLVAYYCPEPLSEAAGRTLRRIDQPRISALVEVEFASAIAIKTRTRELATSDARRVLDLFQSHLASELFGVLPIAAAEYALASRWLASLQTPLRTLDALHLAVAANHECKLVTADRALVDAAKTLRVANKLVS